MSQILVTGADAPGGDSILRRLTSDGHEVATTPNGPVDAAVIIVSAPAEAIAFAAIPHADVEAALDRFLDTAEALQAALARIRDGGALVVVGSRGHLGGWGAAHEMAFSGALVAMVRSISLEEVGRSVRANIIADDIPMGRNPDAVAGTVAFLLSDDARLINGETILTNGGRSLQMREAPDKRAGARSA